MPSKIAIEHELLITLSKSVLTPEEQQRVRTIVSAWPDWTEILYQAATHRVLGLLYHHLNHLELLDWVERDLRNLLVLHHAAIGEKNRAYYGELSQISRSFAARGVRAALLKGPLLAVTVYPDVATRYSNDLDFLVNLSDVNAVTAALNEVGYVQGNYDKKSGSVIPASRQQKIFHQMSTHELQEFVKKSTSPLLDYFAADINHSILWGGHCPYRVDTADLLARAEIIEIQGQDVWRLSDEDCLLQLCCHLYREATMVHWIEDSRDLKLYKFGDIVNYSSAPDSRLDWDRFHARVRGSGLERIVYHVFHHTLALYGIVPATAALSAAAEALRPSELDYLDEYELESGERQRWKRSFMERLFDTRRLTEVGATGRSEDRFEAVKGAL